MATELVSLSSALSRGSIPPEFRQDEGYRNTFGIGATFRYSTTDEASFGKLAESMAERPLQTAAEIVLGHMRNVPPEIMNAMPKDGASQHDHYIYGWPKREA
jgi:hypothetical protein